MELYKEQLNKIKCQGDDFFDIFTDCTVKYENLENDESFGEASYSKNISLKIIKNDLVVKTNINFSMNYNYKSKLYMIQLDCDGRIKTFMTEKDLDEGECIENLRLFKNYITDRYRYLVENLM